MWDRERGGDTGLKTALSSPDQVFKFLESVSNQNANSNYSVQLKTQRSSGNSIQDSMTVNTLCVPSPPHLAPQFSGFT